MSYTFKDLHWANDIHAGEYLLPQSLPEALDMLAAYEGRARVIAGGTDVVPQLRSREMVVEALVDITRLPDMDLLAQEGDHIVLGGAVTHGKVSSSPLIREKAPILAEGAGRMGSPQIRNVATVAGNLVSAHPAADTAIPLLALNGSVTIASKEGERDVPLSGFFKEKGGCVLDCGKEILTRISIPVFQENQGGSYLRLSKRQSLTIAVLVSAVVVRVNPEDNRIMEATMAFGPVAPVPLRDLKTEALLKGAPVSKETVEMAADSAFLHANPISSAVWGSATYKKEMVRVFAGRGLRKALEQAGTPVS